MMTGSRQGVYMIRCTPNGRVYVGSSIDTKARFREHRRALRLGRHHSRLLQRAWSKYGEAAFEFSLIEFVADAGNLLAREQAHIDALGAANPATGMNILPVAGSPRGIRRTAEQRNAMRATMLSLPNLGERVERMAAATRGKKLGPRPLHVRQKIAARLHGRKLSNDHVVKLSAAKSGKAIPDAQRERMVAGLRAHFAAKPRKVPPLPKVYRMDEETLRAGIILYGRGATTAELVPVLGFTDASWCKALRKAGVKMGRRGSWPGVPRPTYKRTLELQRAA